MIIPKIPYQTGIVNSGGSVPGAEAKARIKPITPKGTDINPIMQRIVINNGLFSIFLRGK